MNSEYEKTLLIDNDFSNNNQYYNPNQNYNPNYNPNFDPNQNFNPNYNNQNNNLLNNVRSNEDQIKKISKDIINGLTDNQLSLNDTLEDYENMDDENTKSKKSKKNKKKNNLKDTINYVIDGNKKNNMFDYIYDNINFKDFILIFCLYLLMSQDMVKDLFSNYFKGLRPNEEGKVGAIGVVIYGLILSVLFVFIRIFIKTNK
jgi:hypothetical protein